MIKVAPETSAQEEGAWGSEEEGAWGSEEEGAWGSEEEGAWGSEEEGAWGSIAKSYMNINTDTGIDMKIET